MTRTLLEKCEIPISSEEKTLLQLAASMRQLPAFFYSLPRGSLKTATVA